MLRHTFVKRSIMISMGRLGLEGFLRTHSTLSQADLIRRLTADVLAFCGDARPTDDMTLMSIRRTEMSDRCGAP